MCGTWPKSLSVAKRVSGWYQLLVGVGVDGGLGRTASMWTNDRCKTMYVSEHELEAKWLVAVVPCELRYVALRMSVW